MEEENHVPDKRIRHVLPEEDLEICPHRLPDQPNRATRAEQHPEDARTLLRHHCVHEKARAGKAGRNQLRYIPECCKPEAAVNEQRHNQVGANNEDPRAPVTSVRGDNDFKAPRVGVDGSGVCMLREGPGTAKDTTRFRYLA